MDIVKTYSETKQHIVFFFVFLFFCLFVCLFFVDIDSESKVYIYSVG